MRGFGLGLGFVGSGLALGSLTVGLDAAVFERCTRLGLSGVSPGPKGNPGYLGLGIGFLIPGLVPDILGIGVFVPFDGVRGATGFLGGPNGTGPAGPRRNLEPGLKGRL